MQDLVSFLIKGIVSVPDAVAVREVDGETSVLLELDVASEDRIKLMANEGHLLTSLRAVANAASGRKQAVIELLDTDAEDSSDVGAAEEE